MSLAGELNIVNKRGFINSYPKAQSIKNQNKFVLRKFMKIYKLVLTNSVREYQMTKASNEKSHFSEWKSHVMSSVNEKICTAKNKKLL